jgi:hypothetical protein
MQRGRKMCFIQFYFTTGAELFPRACEEKENDKYQGIDIKWKIGEPLSQNVYLSLPLSQSVQKGIVSLFLRRNTHNYYFRFRFAVAASL